MRAIIVLTILAGIYASSAFTYKCTDTRGKDTAPVCNTTALSSKLPAKVCVIEPISEFSSDYIYYCTEAGYNAWLNSCPKKNQNVEQFCSGTGFYGTFCNLMSCENDDNCPFTKPVPFSDEQPCYKCCQICQEDSVCDTMSGSGKTFAAKGNTNCIPCAEDSAPSTFTPVSSANWTEQVTATITIVLKVGPSFFNVKQLANELINLLNIPQAAIPVINVDFDRSNNEKTVVVFIIENVALEDGSYVDPVAVASELRRLVDSKDKRISESTLLRGMEVVPSPQSSSARNLFSTLLSISVVVLFSI